ncbi:MAG: tRNA 4-thiouridine(8) synthase ThiI [Clostridia bacterium]|nr:tRNA 4-thiouridine(8) synthase ThiI [Clostridia bacterium]MBP5730307.1 tRNA 4-thiouridine(8) synthase ThiI [Clostridia bacterium]
MDRIILGRIGEIALKGLNRSTFEHRLAANMHKAISDLGAAQIHWSQSRYFVEPENDDFDFDTAVKRLSGVFGLVSISPAWVMDTEAELFFAKAVEVAQACVRERGAKTFKVETKRGLKSFPMNSPQISEEAGGRILDALPELSVDVKHPDFIVYIEVRERSYVYTDIIDAPGGMPVGSNGKACLLLSGGIDSPVAGYMIGKRGVAICAVHFYSYPYTSERAKEKVLELARIVSRYTGPMKVLVVPFTDVQLAIMQNCREDLSTILLRRSMMRIAERVARMNGCSALITGESVGQVASQTVQAIYCTDNAVANMPIYRPLIGMDKMETVEIARRIGTFETSIQPYEDCCTVFTPKHPKTRPNLEEVLKEEENYDHAALEEIAIRDIETVTV